MLYIIIISFVMILDITTTICISYFTKTLTLFHSVFAPLGVLLYVLILLGVINLILRFCFPKSYWNYENKFFQVSKKEKEFYEKIKIRKWKSRIPELGKTAGFSKRNLQSLNEEYLERFIYETCIGEVLHLSGAVLGFTCLFLVPIKDYYFTLPILILNFVLNMLPCFIQRYNRARLIVVYKYKTRHITSSTIVCLEQSFKME